MIQIFLLNVGLGHVKKLTENLTHMYSITGEFTVFASSATDSSLHGDLPLEAATETDCSADDMGSALDELEVHREQEDETRGVVPDDIFKLCCLHAHS